MRRAGGRLLAGACALAVAATLAACTGDGDEKPDHTHAAASSAPVRSAGAPSPVAGSVPTRGTPATPSLESAAERWQEHPDDAPEGVSDSGLLLNRRGRGSQTMALPDLRGSRTLLMTLTCATNSYYRLDLRDAGGRDLARIEGGCDVLNVYRTGPLDSADPPVRVQVETPRTVDYYVTVYGLP